MGSRMILYMLIILNLISMSLEDKSMTRMKPVIINGVPAKLGDVPYQVSFKIHIGKKQFVSFCGGTIVGEEKVLTAAHCLAPRLKELQQQLIRVVAGNLLTSATESKETGQWRRVKNGTFHSSYNFPNYDIAIIYVQNKWNFGIEVRSINHAVINKNYDHSCQISGYGKIGYHASPSKVLLLARVRLKSYRVCESILRWPTSDNFICTDTTISDVYLNSLECYRLIVELLLRKFLDNNDIMVWSAFYGGLYYCREDVLRGDSGGPLVCYKTGDPLEISNLGLLVGIVSGKKKGHTFFTRASSYYNWIVTNGMDNSDGTTRPNNIFFLLVIMNQIFRHFM